MSTNDWIASSGVALLLLAYFLNLVGVLENQSRTYHSLNTVGAAVAAYASYRIGFFPFVALEGTWCVVSLVALVRGAGGHSSA